MTFKKTIRSFFCLLLLSLAFFSSCTGTESESESQTNAPDVQKVTDEMIGKWYDPIRPRVTLTVTPSKNEGYDVNISWSDSAYQLYEWRFKGHAEDDRIVTDHCEKVLVTYTDEDVFTEEILYKNGNAELFFDEDGKLCWHDAEENAGEDCRFQKNTAITY